VGCRVEKLQLDTKERLEKAFALYIIVAWRIMFLMRLGRTCPDLPADLVFDPLEWKLSFRLGKKPYRMAYPRSITWSETWPC